MAVSSTSTRARSFLTPLLVCSCFGVILFLIASAIVLSLIPVYLPAQNQIQPLSLVSSPLRTIFPLSGSNAVLNGASLDANTQQSIGNQMQNALTPDSTVPARNIPTVQVLSAAGTTPSGRTRRELTNQVLVTYQLAFPRSCFTKRCQATVLNWATARFTSLAVLIDSSSTVIVTTTTTTTTMTTVTTSATATTTTTATGTTTTLPTTSDNQVTGDITVISNYWANIRPYKENLVSYFGVNDTGLPDGCQVEQVHILHRHGARYPTGQALDGGNIGRFALKILTLRSSANQFTGPLAFLNTWRYQLGLELLVPRGAAEVYASATEFWATYGRILFNAQPGQAYYNSSGRAKLLLRASSLLRIYESALDWAEGFFGPYNTTDRYSLLVLSTAPGSNNTLAASSNCPNSQAASLATYDQTQLLTAATVILANATRRLAAYAPGAANLSVIDTLAMQFLCAYEYAALASSDFCSLFTVNEWRGYEQLFNFVYYQSYSFGSLTGRVLGIGYLEELLARLKQTFLSASSSSVNATLDSSPATFPLNQAFYLDMGADTTILGFLTALSLDYFRANAPSIFPVVDDTRHFRISTMVPFAARLLTEKIGCISAAPAATNATRTQYSPTQYGYSPERATYKFIRMRLNNAVLPLNTLRGGSCAIGRTDGLCPMESFLASQQNASALANFQYVCYGNYTYNASMFTNDGTVFA